MTETEDYSEEESPLFTDPTQIFSGDPNYNHAVHKARYLQVPAEAAIQDAIRQGKLFPSTKETMALLVNTLLDPTNTLAVRDMDALADLELSNDIMFTKMKASFYPYDVRGNALFDIFDAAIYLNKNINTRALGGFERKLQNQSEQVITQRQFMSVDDPARITDPQKKKSIIPWRH